LDSALLDELSDESIKHMSTDELVNAIQKFSEWLPGRDVDLNLCHRDRRCLIRLVFLARQAIRNRRACGEQAASEAMKKSR
jgi:hypothetical protein